ncbi:hypothetical protein Q8F55_001713 [Vanrija albida]|uniref:Uncharacterized protein n=1 Tax=Vanrija albida TaxID=181172 RepID=A0ABR3Q7Q5_9TREE
MYSPPRARHAAALGLRSTLDDRSPPSAPSSLSSSPPSPSPLRQSTSQSTTSLTSLPYLAIRDAASTAASTPARSATSTRSVYASSSSNSVGSSYSDDSHSSDDTHSSSSSSQRHGAREASFPTLSGSMTLTFPTPRIPPRAAPRPELRVDTGATPQAEIRTPPRVPGYGALGHSRARGMSTSMVPSPLRESTTPLKQRQFTRSVSASQVSPGSPRVLPAGRAISHTSHGVAAPNSSLELGQLVKSAAYRDDILPQACPELRPFYACSVGEDAPGVWAPLSTPTTMGEDVIVLTHAVVFSEVVPVACPVKEYSPVRTLLSPGSIQATEQLQTPMTPTANALGLSLAAAPMIDFSCLTEYTVAPEPPRQISKSRGRRVACAAVVFDFVTDDDLDHIDRSWQSLSRGESGSPVAGSSIHASVDAVSYAHMMRKVTDAGRAAKKLGCTVHVSNGARTFQVGWDGPNQQHAAVTRTFGWRRDGSEVRSGEGFGLWEMMAATAWKRMQVGTAC